MELVDAWGSQGPSQSPRIFKKNNAVFSIRCPQNTIMVVKRKMSEGSLTKIFFFLGSGLSGLQSGILDPLLYVLSVILEEGP